MPFTPGAGPWLATCHPAVRCRAVGALPDGRVVHEYELRGDLGPDTGRGLRLRALTLGGLVSSLEAPDARGHYADVVLGLPTLEDYVHRNPALGIIVGRYANRIAGARFELDGETHHLVANEGPNCLHGGRDHFGMRLWTARVATPDESEAPTLVLGLASPDGDQGFPGRADIEVRYTVRGAEWTLDYAARTDRPTVINLSHHDYFNLHGAGSILDHELTIPASRFDPVDRAMIPTGESEVAGTPFDFRQPTRIGARIDADHEQLDRGPGYDHHWILDSRADARGLRFAARLLDPASGRSMEMHTTEPGLQFYAGNRLDGSLPGRDGTPLVPRGGLCLETQHAPDSPNRLAGPSTVVRPGEHWRSRTVLRFDAQRVA
jgi:aldose 1-epimerase